MNSRKCIGPRMKFWLIPALNGVSCGNLIRTSYLLLRKDEKAKYLN